LHTVLAIKADVNCTTNGTDSDRQTDRTDRQKHLGRKRNKQGQRTERNRQKQRQRPTTRDWNTETGDKERVREIDFLFATSWI